MTADSPSKVYGDAVPALTYTYSGLVNGDTASVFNGGLSTPANAGSGVGTYPINQGTLSAGPNYAITLQPRHADHHYSTLTVTANGAEQDLRRGVPALTYTYSGLVNGDTAAVFTGTLSTTASASSGVGTYAVNQGTLAAGPNYAITYNPGTLTVTPAVLTVTANSPSKVYGAACPR